MMSTLAENAFRVIDRGFAGLKFIQELAQENKDFFCKLKTIEN